MVDNKESSDQPVTRPRRRAAARPAGPPPAVTPSVAIAAVESAGTADQKAAPKKASRKKATTPEKNAPEKNAPEKNAPEKKATKKATKKSAKSAEKETSDAQAKAEAAPVAKATAFSAPLFQAPEVVETAPRSAGRSRRSPGKSDAVAESEETTSASPEAVADSVDGESDADADRRRRRRRGGRGRKRRTEGDVATTEDGETSSDSADEAGEGAEDSEESETSDATKRRRRRRRRGADGDLELSPDDPPNTVVKVREPRTKANEETGSMRGSTRLEAKKQRRREGREAGRRRAPILSEAEFLARRESIERVMAVRQSGDRTQIAVLEDGVLVEHYVTRGSSSSMVGNVYLGRVQNVLPSMEAAFVDIGRGRNAVLYAGEVNWDAAGLDGQPKRIEFALKSGDPVLVQVTKDPVGQKGARLTSQISLPGRFLVYVPDGSMTGISRKLPDTERSRLKSILKRVMPEEAGVIVRTAAEGAPEDALEQDVERLQALWKDISDATVSATPPTLLYGEPDLAIKVVRDIFNEDVTKLIVSGSSAWTTIDAYISAVAPDLLDRLENWVSPEEIFAHFRVEEQLMKALDRKVYLPSGGSLVIDRTEAMTVVDVNTGKFTGAGGNLEQTVTKNNLEAAEEIVRQLRLRDIGGIIVVDFIDMVLESNRDSVLRRLVECLGRDRTKHQVAEVTSLGLVQMTRKRIGSGLIESFSENCEACNGRGIKVSLASDPHDHVVPRSRKPAGVVDPAEVAARALSTAPGILLSDEEEVGEEIVEEIVDEIIGLETYETAAEQPAGDGPDEAAEEAV